VANTKAIYWMRKVRLTTGQKCVLLLLASYCDSNSSVSCFPSLKTLAEESGLSRQGLLNILNQLKALNLIQVEQNKKRSGAYSSNTYHLIYDPKPVDKSGGDVNSLDYPMSTHLTRVVNSLDQGSQLSRPPYIYLNILLNILSKYMLSKKNLNDQDLIKQGLWLLDQFNLICRKHFPADPTYVEPIFTLLAQDETTQNILAVILQHNEDHPEMQSNMSLTAQQHFFHQRVFHPVRYRETLPKVSELNHHRAQELFQTYLDLNLETAVM
jgi:hypothetical protein